MDDNIDYLSQLRALHEEYYTASSRLQGFRRTGRHVFGIGSTAKNDPCHKQFAEKVTVLLQEIDESDADEQTVYEVLRFLIYEPEEQKKDKMVYWMLLAIHGAASSLPHRLTQAHAAALAEVYLVYFPRKTQSPAQRMLYKALQKQAED